MMQVKAERGFIDRYADLPYPACRVIKTWTVRKREYGVMATDKSGWVVGKVLAEQAQTRGEKPFIQLE